MEDVNQDEASVKGNEEDDWVVLKRDMHGLLSLSGICFTEWGRGRLRLESEELLKEGRRFVLEVIVTGHGREKRSFYSQQDREERSGDWYGTGR